MSTCQQCGAEVIWKRVRALHPGGRTRPMCYDADGVTIHWDSCSKNRWQQVKATGERFQGKQERESGERGKLLVTGFRNSVHGTKLDMIKAPVIKGANSTRTPCGRDRGECTHPQWEACAQACPNEIRRAA